MKRRTLLLGSAAAGLAFTTAPSLAAPAADLWPRWTPHDPASARTVDHAPWDDLLARYIRSAPDGIHRFAYGEVTSADRAALSSYIQSLGATTVSGLGRDEQFAFWVNLYNALTVRVVLDHYPVDTIRDIDISPGLFANGPWGAELTTVEGTSVTLDDIEHRILRPIWQDPRIHYAVNCAALGCPNLQPQAFTGANLETLLDAGARSYVNHPRGAALTGDRLVVSSIYVWFIEDFGDSDAGVISHLRRYAEPALSRALVGMDAISDDRYDWDLNDAGGAG